MRLWDIRNIKPKQGYISEIKISNQIWDMEIESMNKSKLIGFSCMYDGFQICAIDNSK